MIRRRPKSWEVVVYAGRDPVTGRERRVSRSVPATGNATRPPKAVRDLEARLSLEVGEGHHGAEPRTVAELLDRWLAHARGDLSPTTVHGYERSIRLYLLPALGRTRLDRLSTAALDGLYRRLRTSGGADGGPLAPATIRQAHAVLHRALDRAVKWGWVPRNVASAAEPPRLARRHVSPPAAATILLVLAAAEEHSDDLGDLVALACAGVRRGEACGLAWSDVEDRVAHVRRAVVEIEHRLIVKDAKTRGSHRPVPLPGFVAERLRARRARQAQVALACGVGLGVDAFVLSETPDGSVPLHPNVASDRFRVLTRRLGLQVRLHDLRHATVTLALAAGNAPNDVAAYHGHDSTRMTLDVYGHALPAGLVKIAADLDRLLGQDAQATTRR